MKKIILKENGLTGSTPPGYRYFGLNDSVLNLLNNLNSFENIVITKPGLTFFNKELEIQTDLTYLYVDNNSNLSIATASRGGGGGSGTSGTSGQSGSIGTSGESGTSGTSGVSGTMGESGTSGTSGTGFNTISGYGLNRVLISDGTTNSATASNSLKFDGTLLTVDANLLVTGSFSILGSSSTINTTNLAVGDALIVLAHSQSVPVVDAGILIDRGAGMTQAFYWDESNQLWAFASTNKSHEVAGPVAVSGYSNIRAGGATFSQLQLISGAQPGYFLVSVDSTGATSWTSSTPGTSGTSGVSTGGGGGGTAGTFNVNFDGLGSVISTSTNVIAISPYSGTINSWRILGDVTSGSCSVDMLKWNGTTFSSMVGGGNGPSITNNQRNNSGISGWASSSFLYGDEFRWTIVSCSGFTELSIIIEYTKS